MGGGGDDEGMKRSKDDWALPRRSACTVSFRCSLVQPSSQARRGRLAQAGAGCLEATSIFNLIFFFF